MNKKKEEKIAALIRSSVKEEYNASILSAALYKKLYGKFPKIGLSGCQAEYADILVNELP